MSTLKRLSVYETRVSIHGTTRTHHQKLFLPDIFKPTHAAFLAAFFLIFPAIPIPSISAQSVYGSLTGTVTDPSGAAIPGAQVTVTGVQNGVKNTTTTNSTGLYRFPNLLPATYAVTVTATGFTTVTNPGVDVRVNNAAEWNAQLQLGKTSQTVTVTTAAPLLQTQTAVVQTNLTTRQIENLPIFGTEGGNFQSLLKTIPGNGLTSETNSQAGNPQRAINVNTNGQSYQGTNTRIDGVQDAYPYLPANVAYVPPPDAIETMNVVTNAFTAQQGLAGGAAVNVETKSGSNQFHGDVHEFHTDQNFTARNYFDTDTSPKEFPHKNRSNQNEYGGAVGGPILRNRLFFFFDFDRVTQRQLAGPDTRTLPSAAMASGNFTGLPGNPVIYDPATGNATGAGKTQISCNGVANTICANRIDPAAAALVKLMQPLFAQENGNGLLNWSGSGTAQFNRNNSDSKITWTLSPKTVIWGKYSFSKSLITDPPLLGPAVGDATNGGQLGNAPGLVQLLGIGVTHSFTSNLLFDGNVGYTRQNLQGVFGLTSASGLNDLHIPGTNNAGAPGSPSLYYGLPGFTFSSTYGGDLNLGNTSVANPFQFRDGQFVTDANLSWVKGRHNFKGGFEWNHTMINHFQAQGGTFQNARGQFQFNGFATSTLGGPTPTWYNEWADFMLGLPQETGKARQVFNPNSERWSNWAWYLQDQWQMTPKLSLTYGLRWEFYPFGYADKGKGLRWLNLNTGIVSVGGYGGVPKKDGVDVGHGQYLPRVGIAYRVRPSTVIRGGYGLSADAYDPYHVLLNAYPSQVFDTNLPKNTSNYVPVASLTGTNGTGLGSGSYSIPSGITLLPIPDLSPGKLPLPATAGTTTVPSPYDRGFINSYNFTVEQEFGKSTSFTIGYVGAYDNHPTVNMNANPSAPGTSHAGGVLSQKYGVDHSGTINQLSPFKHTRYDSLQTSLKYLFAGGSNFDVAYTWSKAMDYADEEDLASLLIPYPPEYQKNYGPAAFDRTNNVEISSVIASPFGKGEPWLTTGIGGHILGGWLIDPIISVMSGIPFTVTGDSGALASNGSTQTADLVAPFHLTHGKPPRVGAPTCKDPSCEYFAPSSFATPAGAPHFGNTNRDEFRGPGYFNMDFSLLRDFKIREISTFELRADAMGLTNTPHFNNPNVSVTGSNFGVITGFIEPGGFFGQEPGNRVVWLSAEIKF